jgi:hypothetical protein
MPRRKISKSFLKSGGNMPVVATLMVLIAFIAGLLFGTLLLAKSVGRITGIDSGSYAAGYDAAKKKLADSGLFPRQNGFLSGQITGVSGNEITFSAPLLNPLDDESLKTRVATVSGDTVVNLYRQKTADQAAADLNAGQKTMEDLQLKINSLQNKVDKCLVNPAGKGCDTAAQEYSDALQKQKQASEQMDAFEKISNPPLTDLKVGMQITVYGEKVRQPENQTVGSPVTEAFSDISQAVKFTASLIEVRQFLPAPIITSASSTVNQ